MSAAPELSTIDSGPDERWWGGAVIDGQSMPFSGTRAFRRDLRDHAINNQASPYFISSHGRYLWSDEPFSVEFGAGGITVESSAPVNLEQAGTSLKDAYTRAISRRAATGNDAPAIELFEAPQYNTWIEMPYRPSQESVLRYAHTIVESGLPAGVLMIDDNWAVDYGDWSFDLSRFPDPTGMIHELHELGFSVMLWLVPFVSPDSAVFRDLRQKGFLVREEDGSPALRPWWNGYSGVLDLSSHEAQEWITARLDELVLRHGVDGFKFDAGDIRFYRETDITAEPITPAGQCLAWNRIGLKYEFNEFRAAWNSSGQPLGQRLHDKPPAWGAGGLRSLIPEGLAQSMLGYWFTCADMIGGGLLEDFESDAFVLDQELFVRYAQVAALFPMMQFSLLPSRVLDDEHLDAVRRAVDVHDSLVPLLARLRLEAAEDGAPIMRPMSYDHPDLDDADDQFLLGEDTLCAPVLQRGARSRRVVFPSGRWRSTEGTEFEGGRSHEIPVELTSVPVFLRVSD